MKKIIRIGKISTIHYEAGTADVYFDDEEESVKTALPFLAHEYNMPSVNDTVVCIFQSNSGSNEQGYILGPVYSQANQPEYFGKGVYFKRLSDTSYIKYDPATDTLDIHASKVVIHNLSKE